MGRVVTCQSLLHNLGEGQPTGAEHGVRTYVKKLRRKLSEDRARPRYSFNEFRFESLPLPRRQDPTSQGAVEGYSIG